MNFLHHAESRINGDVFCWGRFTNFEFTHSGGQKRKADEDENAPENKKQTLEEGKRIVILYL